MGHHHVSMASWHVPVEHRQAWMAIQQVPVHRWQVPVALESCSEADDVAGPLGRRTSYAPRLSLAPMRVAHGGAASGAAAATGIMPCGIAGRLPSALRRQVAEQYRLVDAAFPELAEMNALILGVGLTVGVIDASQ